MSVAMKRRRSRRTRRISSVEDTDAVVSPNTAAGDVVEARSDLAAPSMAHESESTSDAAGDDAQELVHTDTAEEDASQAAADTEDATPESSRPASLPSRSLVLAGTSALLVVGALAGWLGYGALQAHTAETTDAQFVEVAKQGALNLANISSGSVQQDVQRIVDSSTGSFLSDFQQRASTFVDFVSKAQSHSQATVRAAGLESRSDTEARVLVALKVKVTAVGVPADDPQRSWRMRVTVQKVDGEHMKLSNVEFVP